MNGVGKLWSRLKGSLWFIPGLMVGASFLLALGLIEVDDRVDRDLLLNYPTIFGVRAEGSRGLLMAIASSMLTVAALAFSLTLNTVAQASSQYTPRVIRNYLDDRWNQFAFGYFVSAFTYCLLVLRTIRGGDDSFIPGIAVLAGLFLAIGGVGVLIFFIHHIGVSLQVTNILARITKETRSAIETLYPEHIGEAVDEDERPDRKDLLDEVEWRTVRSGSSGYLQAIDIDALEDFANEHRFIVKTERELGQFVAEGGALIKVGGVTDGSITEEIESKLNSFFTTDRHRTIDQDVGFGIRQLVDIALKALSPGVNDTTTALNSLDRLGEIIGLLAARDWPADVRRVDERVLVVTNAPSFGDYAGLAFDEIRTNSQGNSESLSRLCEVIAQAAEHTSSDSRRRVLFEHFQLTLEIAETSLRTEYEKRKVRDRASDLRGGLIGAQT